MATYDVTAPSSSAVAGSTAAPEKLVPADGASSAVAASTATYERLSEATGASSAAAASTATASREVEAVGASSAVVSGSATVSLLVDAIGASSAIAYSTARYDGETLDALVTNAGTGAVGQYHGFNFNSFAEVAGRAFAFGDDGAFEVNGHTDDGAGIPFFLQSGTIRQDMGFLRPDKGYLVGKVPPGVYAFALDEDDTRYDYKAYPTEGRFDTSAVQFGKGLRVRHMRYGLFGRVDEPLELSSFTVRLPETQRNV